MQIDNSFNHSTATGDAARDQPSPFHNELQPLTYDPQDAKPSVILVRGELGRIQNAGGGPPAANKTIVPEPRAELASPDAVVTTGGDGIPVLHPYDGQGPLRFYPGGKGTPEQVEATRKLIEGASEHLRGLAGPAALAYELFVRTYNSREGENHIPQSLSLSDAPDFGKDARYQLHYDVDSYVKEDHGPGMSARDMRPKTEISPGIGKLPDNFFAVVADKNNTPLDVLQYDNPGTGTRYDGQYRFNYQTNPDGTSKISVLHFVAPWVKDANPMDLKERDIAGKPNFLAGVSNYYYDSNHHCIEADYYSGVDLKANPQAKPIQSMRFVDGRVDGTFEERGHAGQLDFFDLLGPRIPD
jgi:hypothetical protein